MIRIGRILCAVDFSEVSRRALDHAIALARRYRASLTALHVLPEVVLSPGLGPFPAAPPQAFELDPRARESLLSQLSGMLEPARAAGVDAREVLESGGVVPRILANAQALDADLLVMGTHGVSGFERLVLGSVTEKVVRKARCPVFTVSPPGRGLSPAAAVRFDRILCPLDFSEGSIGALEYAFSLAQESRAEITLLHVAEEIPRRLLSELHFDVGDYRQRVLGAAEARLRELLPVDATDWCVPRVEVAIGKPYELILGRAREWDAHAIVMGVYAAPLLEGLFFLGSTTSHVVRDASCPVLTVRERAKAR
jgi:nucleotide-binding universal stress UspA family protein